LINFVTYDNDVLAHGGVQTKHGKPFVEKTKKGWDASFSRCLDKVMQLVECVHVNPSKNG
jgi:hypothetical protein